MSDSELSSMNGNPWVIEKMKTAAKKVEQNGSVTFSLGSENLALLKDINEHVFRNRPDLVLHVWSGSSSKNISDEELVALAKMTKVKKLRLSGFVNAKLPGIKDMTWLTDLTIATSKALDLSFISSLKKLVKISLLGKFDGLDELRHCTALKSIFLSTTIDSFDFIKPLNKVEEINIDNCIAPNDFAELNKKALQYLNISSVKNLKSVDSLSEFSDLVSLRIYASGVEILPDFRKLKSLQKLHLYNMKVWKNPEILKSIPNLKSLNLDEINTKLKAEQFFFLVEMKSLENVDFRFMDFSEKRIKALRDKFIEFGKKKLLPE